MFNENDNDNLYQQQLLEIKMKNFDFEDFCQNEYLFQMSIKPEVTDKIKRCVYQTCFQSK